MTFSCKLKIIRQCLEHFLQFIRFSIPCNRSLWPFFFKFFVIIPSALTSESVFFTSSWNLFHILLSFTFSLHFVLIFMTNEDTKTNKKNSKRRKSIFCAINVRRYSINFERPLLIGKELQQKACVRGEI